MRSRRARATHEAWRREADLPNVLPPLAFDASLRARNPAWGVRSLEAVLATAATHGLERERVVDMPSNNLTVVLQRGEGGR